MNTTNRIGPMTKSLGLAVIFLMGASTVGAWEGKRQVVQNGHGVYDPMRVVEHAIEQPMDIVVVDSARKREIPIRVYLPSGKQAAPVILFSHGLGGSREGSGFLGRHWANRGFVAVFLQHPGSDEGVWKGLTVRERQQAMRDAASATNYLLRAKDVSVVLDQLTNWQKAKDSKLAGRLDMSRVGMSGHSFGALTTQAVSGQSAVIGGQSLTDSRIKAAVIFSPSVPAQGEAKDSFAKVHLPWLLMTGTKDVAHLGASTIGASSVEQRLAVYPALPPGSKYELVLDGAEHSVFTDRPLLGDAGTRNPNHHRAILALSTAFWDAYLNGDSAARSWLDGASVRAILEVKDRWQKK